LKAKFGEKGEDSIGGRQEKGTLGGTYDKVNIDIATKEEYSTETLEGVARELEPTTLENVGLHHEVDETLQ
jgi:hypothetical protein